MKLADNFEFEMKGEDLWIYCGNVTCLLSKDSHGVMVQLLANGKEELGPLSTAMVTNAEVEDTDL